MANSPPPPKAVAPLTAQVVDQPAQWNFWNNVPGVYNSLKMPVPAKGTMYFIDANAGVLENALSAAFPIRTAPDDAAVEVDLDAVLRASEAEGKKLGWNVSWRIDAGVISARVPNAEADKVADTTFDFHKGIAKTFGAEVLRDTSFEFEFDDD